MGRPAGAPNAPRTRAIKTLEERFPEFADGGLLFKLAEQAVLAERALVERAGAEGGEPITVDERQTLQVMYERVTKFVLPQLKAVEMSVDASSGSFTVKIEKPKGG